ncbi:MAG: hypothetical protein Q7T30_00190, partial [Planctomycetota bacterium]|nr:hypothetical protein [Planctomycetota bacterium]
MRRCVGLTGDLLATALLLLTVAAPSQHDPAPAPHKPASPAEQKRGSAEAPTHAPQPELPPAVAFDHVRAGNTACAAARKAGDPPPVVKPRPAGAGRYVCAVIVCADADLDLPTLLGLRRSDVLLISTPGPFVQQETVALLERCVAEERLSLVLVLSHTHCATLQARPGITPRQDALTQRLVAVQKSPYAANLPLGKAMVLAQRQMLLLSSDLLEQRAGKDQLRVVPGEIDTGSHTITWHGA